MIKFKIKKKKSFSLIELLVAVTIFALALVIAFGAFTLTLGNQSFVQANSEVNTEGSRIIRQISDDIINANGIGSTSGTVAYSGIKGIIMFDSEGYIKDSTDISSEAGFLVLFYKDSLKVYFLDLVNKKIMLYTEVDNNLTLWDGRLIRENILESSQVQNSEKTEVDKLTFFGSACYKTRDVIGCDQQPFAGIDFQIKTLDYDKRAPAKRSKFYLQTLVESRMQ